MCAYSYSCEAKAYVWFIYERQQMTSSSNRYIQMTTFMNAFHHGGRRHKKNIALFLINHNALVSCLWPFQSNMHFITIDGWQMESEWYQCMKDKIKYMKWKVVNHLAFLNF